MEMRAWLGHCPLGAILRGVRPDEAEAVGAAPLCRLYALALEHHGIRSEIAPSDLAATGLALIAERAGWK